MWFIGHLYSPFRYDLRGLLFYMAEKIQARTLKRRLLRVANKLINEKEVYKKVDIAPSYEISNLGNIWYCPKYRKLKGCKNRKGYVTVKLYLDNGGKYCTGVHRLVAAAFIPNPLNLPEVNHKDGIKTNNRVSNLEWCTTKQNVHHAIEMGLRTADINLHRNNLFNTEDLIKIRELCEKGINPKIIAAMYKCHYSTIYKIRGRG